MQVLRSILRRAAPRALACAAAFGAILVAPAAGQSPSQRIYIYRGEPQTLDIRLDRVAVRFAPDASPSEREAFLERARPLGTTDPEMNLGFAGLALLRLDAPPRIADELDRVLRALAADPALAMATPVYRTDGATVVPTGQLFLQLRDGAPENAIEEIRAAYDLNLLRRTPWTDGNFVLAVRGGNALDPLALAEEIGRRPEVAFCEPDFAAPMGLLETATDPMFPRQWSLHSTGQDSGGKLDGDLDVPEAWEVQQGANGVRIAILDTGIQTAHPDLAAAMDLANAWDFIQNDADPNPAPGEPYGDHGTKCSGVAGAIPNNGIGLAGVAGGSRIIPVRIGFEGVITNAIAADAIGYAWMHQADVISCSWFLHTHSDQVDRAIREAVTRGRNGRGTVVCFAAGNFSETSARYPASLDDVIAVAATSPCDSLKTVTSCDGETSWGSNYGTGVDVGAPGVHIRTTTIGSAYVENFNGTSSACPHVAGVAALLIAKFPDYEGTEIRARLEQTCDRVGGYAYDATTGRSFELGYGRVNAYRALSGKPQVIGGTMPNHPSIYRDASDARGYPSAAHESAAYEWLGEETSPEVSPADTDDPDGAPNLTLKDAFDDGVFLTPPYIPGTQNQITFTVSVEDHTSRRYANKSIYLNCWVDWEADGNWTDAVDRVVTNHVLQPSTWTDDTESITIPIQVPDVAIGWHVQSGQPQRFLNVRARVSYDATLASATQPADWGEVEDHAILNFVEMFEAGTGYMTHQGACDPWAWVDGAAPWLPPCNPPFRPDAPQNGYMSACIYNPAYAGDDTDMLRTPTFDLSELTEARLEYEFSGVELAFGRVVLYVNGLPRVTLRTYNGVVTSNQGPCMIAFPDAIDLTPYTGDGFNNVFIAFEVFHDEPCGTQFPTYQDWLIDNVVVTGVDAIRPAPIMPTVARTSDTQADLAWTTPGDDGTIRRAELYNIRYSPRAIDAQAWRHALWVRKNMTTGLPTPQQPGAPASLTVRGLESGLHHFCVRAIDEVNLIAPVLDGGANHDPVVTPPTIPDAEDGDTVQYIVSATDPDFDALFLGASSLPAGATFVDNGNRTGTFQWSIPLDGGIGSHTMAFSAEDWNGARDEKAGSIRVLPSNIAPDDADHDDGAYVLTVTSHGTLGFLDGTGASGSGFVYPKADGVNQIFIGGLWVGTDGGYVANRDYDADPGREWRTAAVPDGHMRAGTGGPANEEWIGAFTDNYADAPRGLLVEQRSWAFTAPDMDDACIIRYTITNRGAYPLTGVYAGCFLDLDLRGDGTDDTGGTDATRSLAWVTDASGIFTGVRLLDPGVGGIPVSNVTLVSNPTFVWPNQYILDADKHAFLTASDPQHVLTDGPTPSDYSTLVAAGPFDLAPGDVREFAVAVIGATSHTHLQQNADRAQAIYAGLASDAAAVPVAPAVLELLSPTPNPFRGETVLAFRTPSAGNVVLDVHDVNGRLVRRLASGERAAGEHHVLWDGTDASGHPVPSGSYFLRLAVSGANTSAAIRRLR